MTRSLFRNTLTHSTDPVNSEVSHLLQLVHTLVTSDSTIADNQTGDSTTADNQTGDSTIADNQTGDSRITDDNTQDADVELKRCATELEAAGIEIKTPECNPSNSPSNSEIAQRFDFGIKFNDSNNSTPAILEIPPLHITETTEAKWRNFIAWEQNRTDWRNTLDWQPSQNGHNCKFTSYALFFRGLICCVHDVELLKEKNIIIDDRQTSKEKGGDDAHKRNEELLDIFHKITVGVDHMDSTYTDDCKNLNACSKTNSMKKWILIKWHHFRRTVTDIKSLCRDLYRNLIRDHMPTVWKTL